MWVGESNWKTEWWGRQGTKRLKEGKGWRPGWARIRESNKRETEVTIRKLLTFWKRTWNECFIYLLETHILWTAEYYNRFWNKFIHFMCTQYNQWPVKEGKVLVDGWLLSMINFENWKWTSTLTESFRNGYWQRISVMKNKRTDENYEGWNKFVLTPIWNEKM